MYYVTFVGSGKPDQEKKGPTILAVRAVNIGDYKWLLEDDFNDEHKQIIETRFDKEIISKIEKIIGVKSIRER